ncbi:unnamed protein product, partial [Linum tenue]
PTHRLLKRPAVPFLCYSSCLRPQTNRRLFLFGLCNLLRFFLSSYHLSIAGRWVVPARTHLSWRIIRSCRRGRR